MMKEVLRAIETGILPQIGLIAFVVAFIGVLYYVFSMPKQDREYDKNLPLDDGIPVSVIPFSNHVV
jgi:cbb3-type cytochrome oxidase subunit 3